MIDRQAAWLAHQRKRWMRPDAYRWMRPDAVRFLKPGSDAANVFPALDRKYSPSQRRIPRGQPGGGRWTDDEGEGGFDNANPTSSTDAGVSDDDAVATDGTALAFQDEGSSGSLDDWNALLGRLNNDGTPQPIPNADPDDAASNAEDIQVRRGPGGLGEYFPGSTPVQQFRLDAAIARGEIALAQVRRYDPDWKPQEQSLQATQRSLGSIEGAIAKANARAAEAETRWEELRTGIGGGLPPSTPPSRPPLPLRSVFDALGWIDMYRSINNSLDLFGQPIWPRDDGTVAVTKIDGTIYFGVNSGAPGYRDADRLEANFAALESDNEISRRYGYRQYWWLA
jgi:hypothetical protein